MHTIFYSGKHHLHTDFFLMFCIFYLPLWHRPWTNSHQTLLFVATCCSFFHVLISLMSGSKSLLCMFLDLPLFISLCRYPVKGFSSYTLNRFSYCMIYLIRFFYRICLDHSIIPALVILSYQFGLPILHNCFNVIAPGSNGIIRLRLVLHNSPSLKSNLFTSHTAISSNWLFKSHYDVMKSKWQVWNHWRS